MNQIVAFPSFAPLSTTMVRYLLNIQLEELLDDLLGARRLLFRLIILERQVIVKRDQLFAAMSAQTDLSVNWFRSAVTPTKRLSRNKHMLSLQTVKNLRDGNIFRFHRWGQPDIDSAASIVLSSWVTADAAFREVTAAPLPSFVPSSQSQDEPFFWCYVQYPPGSDRQPSPVIPCPWPNLPANLPTGTLLYSRWPVFDPSWLQFPNGAIRFSSIDEDSLERWDPSLKSHDIRRLLHTIRQGVKDNEAYEALRTRTLDGFAQSVLQKLALSRLTSVPLVASGYPILWDHSVIWPHEIAS